MKRKPDIDITPVAGFNNQMASAPDQGFFRITPLIWPPYYINLYISSLAELT